MPRKAEWPPKVRRHASGQAQVRWKGRDYYLGPHGSEEAQKRYLELLPQLLKSSPPPEPVPPPSALTVRSVVTAWLEREAPRYTDRGREVGQFVLAFRPLLALHAATPASAFGVDELEAVQLAMAGGSWKEGARPLSARVVNRRVVRLRTAWRWAERKKLAPPGSWAGLRALPPLARNDPRVRHTSPRKGCSFDDLLKVARAAWPVVRAMLLLQWWTGMRPGEVRVMRPGEVDRSDPGVWIYRPAVHKNDWRGQARAVVLGRKAQSLLRPWLDRAPAGGYVFPPHRPRPGSPGCYTMAGYCQSVQGAARRAGVEGFTAYQARHSCKQRVTRELGLDAARSVLGQKSITSTDGYGEQVDLKQATDAARKLG